MLAATMPDPASAVSNVIGIVAPAFGDRGPATTSMRLGAALARRHRLVAQVRVARENRPRLLIGVLGEIAQDEDDLVLDVEPGVAVVAEVLALGHDQAVAGEDDRCR